MGWDEALYSKAEKWLGRLRTRRHQLMAGPTAVSLEEVRESLHIWAALLSGRSWTVQESEDWPSYDEERVFLPPILEIFSEKELNRAAYYYICATLVGFPEANFSELGRWRERFQENLFSRSESLSDFEVDRLYTNSSPRIEISQPSTEQPRFRRVANLFVAVPIQTVSVARVSKEIEGRTSGKNTAIKKKAINKVELIESLEQAQDENPLVHSFEKVHTTDDYTGGRKHQDAENELDDHADSLEDLDLRQLIRSSQNTSASMKGDFAMDVDVSESEEWNSPHLVHRYQEWNYKEASYLPNWCQLSQDFLNLEDLSNESRLNIDEQFKERQKRMKKAVELLRRQLVALLKSPVHRSGRTDGAEVDVDALVDLMSTPVDFREGRPRIYLDLQKSFREVSVIVLFDRSLSSDSWIDDKRVMDVIKDALVTVGEALEGIPIAVQLAGFSSRTRNEVSYTVIKRFEGSWKTGLRRLMALEPSGYTRIGPALRHCARVLERRKSRHKWIILISDGKPTDLDRYEGHYGVQDVKQAVREAARKGIGVRCISIENQHRSELSEMFGIKGYELLTRPEHLPLRISALLKDLIKRARV